MINMLMKIVGVAILVVVCSTTADAASARKINVDFHIKQHDGEANLEIELTSRERREFQVYRSDLPWGNVYSTIVVGVVLNGTNELITPVPIIDDLSMDMVAVRPGEKLSGIIPIHDRLPNLESVLRKFDVLVFWSYRMDSTDASSKRFSGSAVLTKLK